MSGVVWCAWCGKAGLVSCDCKLMKDYIKNKFYLLIGERCCCQCHCCRCCYHYCLCCCCHCCQGCFCHYANSWKETAQMIVVSHAVVDVVAGDVVVVNHD